MRELEYYKDLLTARKISRREFMGRAAALGVTAALASTMASKAIKASEPKKGGTLRYGCSHGSTTDSLDPATYENGFTGSMCFNNFNYLTEVGTDGQVTPALAESWEASADASTWTFKLRKGVEFHNGKTLTAEDVIASINHHRGEDSKSAAKPIVDPVEDMKADGDDTVVFELKGGNADFPFIVSDYHLTIQPGAEGKIDWASHIGTGPYPIKEYDAGLRASFTRNPNYWKEGRAHFDGIEMLTIADVTARTNALTTGEVDTIDRVDLKTVHLLKRNDNVVVEETTGTFHNTFPMRTDTAPFDDNNVRMALKHAVDREELVQKILKGHGIVGNDHPISVSNRYHHGDAIPQRTYDPDKAKFYLKEAGLSELTVDLSAADAAFANSVDAAVLMKERAGKAGININVVREPNDGYWSDVWMKKPWCACYWGGRPTEDWMFSTAYSSGASWNDTFWEHEKFNKLLIEARGELDEAKRREMYVEMQLILRDEGGVLVAMFPNYVFATTDKVAHGEMSGNWDMDGGRLAERWWFG